MKTAYFLIQFILSCSEVISVIVKNEGTNTLIDKLALGYLKATIGENTVVSPLALKFPLCKLADVATGAAKKELMHALGLKTAAMARKCYTIQKSALQMLKERDLILLDKIFLNTSYNLNPSFTANLTEEFGVQYDQIGFYFQKAATSFINRWVSSATLKRIQDVMEPKEINKDTSMVIVNAAHFKSTWEFEFDIKQSKMQKFRLLNGTIIMIPMMAKAGEYLYSGDSFSDFKLITLYLKSWGGTVTFVLPNAKIPFNEFLSRAVMNLDFIRSARRTTKYEYVKFTSPRVKIKSNIDWDLPLKQIGIKKIFTSNSSGLANMLQSNTTKDVPYLSKVKQKNFIEIDEFGVFRSRSSLLQDYINIERNSRLPATGKVYEMILDRPFLFTVCVLGGAQEIPGNPMMNAHELFVGAYYGPR